MEFSNNQPIYLQIADMICEKILANTWKENERIPSVRDLAGEIQVNPNTVMRAYTYLEEKGVIANQRGIGFFAAQGSLKETRNLRIEKLITAELNSVFRTMDLLGLNISDLKKYYDDYKMDIVKGE